MRQRVFFLQVATACLLSGGCAPDDLPKSQEISSGLRVLAIKASQPEVALSSLPAVVSLTIFVSDRDGGGRPVEIRGSACLDPGVSLGVEPSCDGVTGAIALTSSVVTPTAQAANSQVFGSPSYIGSLPALSVSIPSLPTLGARPATQLFNGVGFLIALELKAGSETRRAHKRIVVSSKTTPNANPSITSVLFDGQAAAALPTQAVGLSVASAYTGTYEFMTESGELRSREKPVRVTHLISDGASARASSSPSEAVTWTPPSAAPGGRPVSLVSIVADGIGGIDVRITDL